MDKTFIEAMKTKLEAEAKELEADLASVSAPDSGDHVQGTRAATFPNYGDDAMDENTESPQEVSDYSVNLDVTETLEKKLHAVQQGLQRIAKGTYGQCAVCGNDIGEERLQANPAAAECMNCAH